MTIVVVDHVDDVPLFVLWVRTKCSNKDIQNKEMKDFSNIE
jgi:hypothetical protein